MKNISPSRMKKIVVIGGIVSVIVIGYGVYIILNTNNANNTQGQYVDPGSGETISNPPGKTPENFGDTTETIYLGTARLSELGLTQYQLLAYKQALTDYAKQTSAITEASVTVNTVTFIPGDKTSETARDALEFELTINRTTKYSARLEFVSIGKIQLLLFKPGESTPVFTSEVINGVDISVKQAPILDEEM